MNLMSLLFKFDLLFVLNYVNNQGVYNVFCITLIAKNNTYLKLHFAAITRSSG